MHYIDIISEDIISIILIYLDKEDILQFENIIDIDYNKLFLLKYNEYYYINIIEYNVKEICLDFISNRNLDLNIINNYESFNINTVKYCLINDIVSHIKLDMILYCDSIKLFVKFEYDKDFLKSKFGFNRLINNYSYNILEYVLKTKL